MNESIIAMLISNNVDVNVSDEMQMCPLSLPKKLLPLANLKSMNTYEVYV